MLKLRSNAHGSKNIYSCRTINIISERYWLVEGDKKRQKHDEIYNLSSRWTPFKSIVLFFTRLKIIHPLYDFMILFILLYEKLYYLLGWELDPGSTHMGTQVSVFFQKSLRNWFLLLIEPDSLFSAWFFPNATHDSQSENQTVNRDENQVLLWEPPNTGHDHWSGPLVPSN